MSNIEEAEIRDNGDVMIRYYRGKTVLIPREIMLKESIIVFPLSDVIKDSFEEVKPGIYVKRGKNGSV